MRAVLLDNIGRSSIYSTMSIKAHLFNCNFNNKADKKVGVQNMAIIDKKRSSNRLIVGDFFPGDNSVVCLSPAKMAELQLSRGDTVLLKGDKGKDTLCIAFSNDNTKNEDIQMNKVIRKNFRVQLGDTVTIAEKNDISNCKKVRILPLEDTIEGVPGNLINASLKAYFQDAYRPIRKGDLLFVRVAKYLVEFKIVEMDPDDYGVHVSATEIDCEGEPVKREDEERDGSSDSQDDYY